jgi:hypothetical protein
MALDERRLFFPLTRMSGTRPNEAGRLIEIWFRGVHSDVGGGDEAVGLSSIALNFVFEEAIRAGLPIDRAAIATNAKRANPNCPICLHPQHGLEQLAPFREIRRGDLIHWSVTQRADGNGRHHNNAIASCIRINDSGEIATAV